MLLEVFIFAISTIIFAWCTHLMYDTFQNEPFMKVIKSIAHDIAFLFVLGSYFTLNPILIISILLIVGGSCIALIFGKQTEHWFESKYNNRSPQLAAGLKKRTNKKCLQTKSLAKPRKAASKLAKV